LEEREEGIYRGKEMEIGRNRKIKGVRSTKREGVI